MGTDSRKKLNFFLNEKLSVLELNFFYCRAIIITIRRKYSIVSMTSTKLNYKSE